MPSDQLSSARLLSLCSRLTHSKTPANQGWRPHSTPPGRAVCLLLTLRQHHHSTWASYYNCSLLSYLPDPTESPEDKDLIGSISVSLRFHCRAWHRVSAQTFTGQVYTTAIAELWGQLQAWQDRNHLILEGKSSTSVRSEPCFLAIWPSRAPLCLQESCY